MSRLVNLRIFHRPAAPQHWILDCDVTSVNKIFGHKAGAETGSDSLPRLVPHGLRAREDSNL